MAAPAWSRSEYSRTPNGSVTSPVTNQRAVFFLEPADAGKKHTHTFVDVEWMTLAAIEGSASGESRTPSILQVKWPTTIGRHSDAKQKGTPHKVLLNGRSADQI